MARRLVPPLNHIMAAKIIFAPKANAAILSPENTIKAGWVTQFWKHYTTRGPDYSLTRQSQTSEQYTQREKTLSEGRHNNEDMQSRTDTAGSFEDQIGKNVSKKDKISFLVNTLMGLKESKEAVYGTLDAWVAWEQKFPIASLRIALSTLEKEQEWHKIIQVIKWILSKGQGNTMGVYKQLINALDKDDRAEEAHNFWTKKIGNDLHSVPWEFCTLMISIYHRNNMLERLVKLFKGLEAFDRKPQSKLVVQKVADAYEVLGCIEQKNRVMEKYNDLFAQKTWRGNLKTEKKSSRKEMKKSDQRKELTTHNEQRTTRDEALVTSCSQTSESDGIVGL